MYNNLSLIEIHNGRTQLYYFLARVFIDVPDENLYSLTADMVPAFEILSQYNNMLHYGCLQIKEFIKTRNSKVSEEKVMFDNNILNNYSNLFCKSGGLSLYQSMYPATYRENIKENLFNIFKQYDFETAYNNQESDHISSELSFTAHLAALTSLNLRKNNNDMADHLVKVQLSMIDDYMLKWIKNLAYSISDIETGDLFYAPMINIINGFLEQDKIFLNKLI